MNKTIFKSYDVRGVYPSELNEASAFAIGRAFIRHSKTKKIVVGRDARLSSPELLKAFVRGVYAEGGAVGDVGQVPTECVYFALGTYDFDGGAMVTASHNPKEYNGFKMMQKDGNDIQMVRGKDLISVVKDEKFEAGEDQEITKKDIWKDFLNHIFSFVDLSEIVPLKVVVDASNGVAGNVIAKITDKLPVEIIPLNFEPDGNFPNHSPNPLEKGSSNKISQIIKQEKADFGLMFDGDADRVFLVNENGELVRADATLLLLAKYFLDKHPGMAIAYNAICSKAVPEFVKKWGGKPVRTQVGFVNVRDGLLKNNGIMGGELSGHYCFKDNFYMDSGMIAFLSLLQIISKDGREVSEIIKELTPYFKSPEANFRIDDKEAVLEKVKEKYKDGEQDFLDGVTVIYKDWWFNVRASNTEPVLRLTIEADTKELYDKKQKELTKLIK
ncbi:MAG: phosphomannomutase/phosphoglucomutase [Candidatus Staskawiczbacteria bacterium]|nr:phosphomannomutase/phosphoglucomutase [Candidatus Staskawiczbacteria bacterium]